MFYFLRNLKVLIIVSVFILISSCEKRDIYIGFSGQLTGINSDLGIHGRNGAILAVEDINRSGGIKGHKITLISKDDMGFSDTALKVDKELIDMGVTAILGHMTSDMTMSVIPLINKEKVVLLSPTTSTPKLSGKKDYFFRVQGSSSLSSKALGQFIDNMPGINNFLIVRDIINKDFTDPYKEVFLKSIKKGNDKLIFDEIQFTTRHPEKIETLLTKIDKCRYDAVVIIASARITAIAAQYFSDCEKDIKIFSSSWGATGDFIRHGGKASEGVYFAKTGFVKRDNKEYLRFKDQYEKRFGLEPSFAAEQGYHAAKILSMALKETGGKGEGLRDALANIKNFHSFHGKLSINKFGDAKMPVSIIKIENGVFKEVASLYLMEE